MDEWIVKVMEIAEMAKPIVWLKKRTKTTFIKDWKSFVDFLLKMDINELVIYGFIDWKGKNGTVM